MPTPLLSKQRLFDTIASYLPDNPVIVEAGAFNGSDTKRLSIRWPKSIIHTFEPVPDIFRLLEENTITIPHVRRYQSALSSYTGTASFYVSEKPSQPGKPFQAGSLHKPKDRLLFSDIQYNKIITVSTITLDEWAATHNIEKIDFLWLDMQGHELNVLKAAPRLLKTVTAIYTEVSFGQAYENQYTYEEVKQWLTKHEFTEIGKDFIDQKTWFFGNVLFVKQPFNARFQS